MGMPVDSQTKKNLKAAFAGESMANRRYLAFAKIAEREGRPQAAKMFRAAAASETVHAHKYMQLAGELGGCTFDHLKASVEGETYEAGTMYPQMIADAEADGNTTAAKYLAMVVKVEEEHAKLYTEVMNDTVKDRIDYYVCPNCGYIHVGKPEGVCPLCSTDVANFTEIV